MLGARANGRALNIAVAGFVDVDQPVFGGGFALVAFAPACKGRAIRIWLRVSTSSPRCSPTSPWTCGSARRRSSSRSSPSSNGTTRARRWRRSTRSNTGSPCSIWTNDLVTRIAPRRGWRRASSGSRRVQALPRRAVRRLQAVRRRTRGRHRGAHQLHAREEHPPQFEASRRRA